MFTKKDILNFTFCPSFYKHENDKPNDNSVVAEYLTYNGKVYEQTIRDSFDNGVFIPFGSYQLMLNETEKALLDPNVKIIFEATFTFNSVLVRLDILIKTDNGFKVIENKASKEVEDKHIEEVSVQAYVLSNLFPNKNIEYFVQNNNDIQLNPIKPLNLPYDAIVEMMKRDFKSKLEFKCKGCEHFLKCFPQYQGKITLFNIPRISEKAFHLASNENVFELEPRTYDFLSDKQQIILSKHFRGFEINKEYLRRMLPEISSFLDFETIFLSYPIKHYQAFEKIPVQFSYTGKVSVDYIDDGDLNKLRFIQELIKAVPKTGLIGVYNATFERMILNECIEYAPQYKEELQSIIDRLFDYYPLIQVAVYSPEMNFKFDLKSVSKAILKRNYYDGLIKKGDEAMAYFVLDVLLNNNNRKDEVKAELVKYCKADTKCLEDLNRYLINHIN